MKTIINDHWKKLILGSIVAALALSGIILLATQQEVSINQTEKIETVTILPVPTPAEGERLRDIPVTDAKKREDMLRSGAAEFGVSPKQALNQQAVASACVYDATAQITHDARASETYRNDTEKIKADIKAVNQNCYAKYSDTDYVAPEPGPAHVHPDTFEPHH